MESPKGDKSKMQKQRESFCLGLVMKIAAAANVTLELATQTVYLEQLLSLEPSEMTQATQRTIREWDKPHMMPPLAYIIERSGNNPKLKAEQAWEALQRFVYKNWHPDIGFTSTLRLDPATEYAVRQCGGLHRIHDATEEAFPFIRREFLQSHERFIVEGGTQTRLSQEMAKKTLDDLRSRMKLIDGGKEE